MEGRRHEGIRFHKGGGATLRALYRDQTFSPNNLHEALWELVRNGRSLESLIPETRPLNEKVSVARKKRREALATVHHDESFAEIYAMESRQVNSEKEARRTLISEKIAEFASSIAEMSTSANIPAAIIEGGVYREKQTYRFSDERVEQLLALKVVEKNLKSAFDIRTTNRHEVVQATAALLNNKVPKTLFRGDVRSFFENVPHDKLLEVVRSNKRLSRITVGYVERFLGDTSMHMGEQKGLPRGISLSSILAEVYMKGIDDQLQAIDSVMYYARFVDDFILIRSDPKHSVNRGELRRVVARCLSKLGLELNASKSRELSTADAASFRRFQLLGYSIRLEMKNGEVEIDMSQARFAEFKRRIDLSFAKYHMHKAGAPEAAATALTGRLKILTGNRRRASNIGSTMHGVYYSSRALREPSRRMVELDRYLESHFATLPDRSIVADRMQSVSFVEGFRQRAFVRIRPTRVAQLTRIWKN